MDTSTHTPPTPPQPAAPARQVALCGDACKGRQCIVMRAVPRLPGSPTPGADGARRCRDEVMQEGTFRSWSRTVPQPCLERVRAQPPGPGLSNSGQGYWMATPPLSTAQKPGSTQSRRQTAQEAQSRKRCTCPFQFQRNPTEIWHKFHINPQSTFLKLCLRGREYTPPTYSPPPPTPGPLH